MQVPAEIRTYLAGRNHRLMLSDCPFIAWNNYFLHKTYHPDDELVRYIVCMTEYFWANQRIVHSSVDLRLYRINIFYGEVENCLGAGSLKGLLEEIPETTIACIGIAISQVYYTTEHSQSKRKPVKLAVRLFGYGEALGFRDLKAFQVGKIIRLKANIVRVSAVRPLPLQIVFQCGKCMQSFPLPIFDRVYRTPSKCRTSQCNSKVFLPIRDSRETIYLNSQRLRLQEVVEIIAGVDDEGRIPRVIEGELTSDLVDCVVPGESVTIAGILKSTDYVEKGQVNSTSSLYLDIISVEKEQNFALTPTLTSNVGSHAESSQFPQLAQILSIAQGKETLNILVKSFSPRIYGNDLVKLGMLLALVGGSRRSTTANVSNKLISIRSDPHCLVVGDPGLGKSQLLNYAAYVAPRAVYVSANTATAAGLTATVQDGGLEAGALVLADQGCCCIDEFDKIGGDGWRSLLDVMEQQSVNVAKAGVVCSLPARTSIIAAANPVGGHYNRAKSVVDNLKMDAALLSRFDLVFVLLDKPNADLDKVLSEHVLGSVSSDGKRSKTITPTQSSLIANTPRSLIDRLSGKTATQIMSSQLLREYIAYARAKVSPKMTEEAAEVLKIYYLELRTTKEADENLPITTRHLESLIRLSEARAKLELRGYVSLEDAQDVIELMKCCTADILGDGRSTAALFGNNKAPRKGSKSAGIKRFASELVKISSRTSEIDFTPAQLQSLYDAIRITELPFRELLDSLNEHGYILKKAGVYRLLTT